MADLSPQEQALIVKYHNQRLQHPELSGQIYDKLAAAGVTGTDPRLSTLGQRQALVQAQGRRAASPRAPAKRTDDSFSRVGSDPTDYNQVVAAQAQAGGLGGVGGELSGAPEGMGLREVAGLAGGMTAGMLAGRRTAPAVRGMASRAVEPAVEAISPVLANIMHTAQTTAGSVRDALAQHAAAIGMPIAQVASQARRTLRQQRAAIGATLQDVHEQLRDVGGAQSQTTRAGYKQVRAKQKLERASEGSRSGKPIATKAPSTALAVRPPQGARIGPDVPKPKAPSRTTQQTRAQARADVNARTEGPAVEAKPPRAPRKKAQSNDLHKQLRSSLARDRKKRKKTP